MGRHGHWALANRTAGDANGAQHAGTAKMLWPSVGKKHTGKRPIFFETYGGARTPHLYGWLGQQLEEKYFRGLQHDGVLEEVPCQQLHRCNHLWLPDHFDNQLHHKGERLLVVQDPLHDRFRQCLSLQLYLGAESDRARLLGGQRPSYLYILSLILRVVNQPVGQLLPIFCHERGCGGAVSGRG